MSSVWNWLLVAAAIVAVSVGVFLSRRAARTAILSIGVVCFLSSAWSIEWDAPLTALTVLKLCALYWCSDFTISFFRREWRLWNGLDQWPDPRGRYYDKWRSLPAEAGDYYEWLACQKGGAEPWASWAVLEREMESKKLPDR